MSGNKNELIVWVTIHLLTTASDKEAFLRQTKRSKLLKTHHRIENMGGIMKMLNTRETRRVSYTRTRSRFSCNGREKVKKALDEALRCNEY